MWQYGVWHMRRSGPEGFLDVPYPQSGSRNVQARFAKTIGTIHHRGDTVWHLGRDEGITMRALLEMALTSPGSMSVKVVLSMLW